MTKSDKTKETDDMPQWKAEGYQSQAQYEKWNAPFNPADNWITRKIASGEWERKDIDLTLMDNDEDIQND